MNALLRNLQPAPVEVLDARTETLTHALLDACDALERNARDAFASARDTHEEFLDVWLDEDAPSYYEWQRLKNFARVAQSGRPWPFGRMTREQQRAVGFVPRGV